MERTLGVLTIGLMVSLYSMTAKAEQIDIDNGFFSVSLDCDTKSAVAWHYVATKDRNNYKRHDRFYFDESIPSRCQQTSRSTYKSVGVVKYDRGHLVPANVMDSSKEAIRESNMMYNVLPMVAQMNRGSWYQTELWVECRRDANPVSVWGGVYQGTTPQDGNFMVTHGVQAPEAFYKVALQGNTVAAWWVPNSVEATKSRVDSYLTSVRAIEQKTSVVFPLPDHLKDNVLMATDAKTPGCYWN